MPAIQMIDENTYCLTAHGSSMTLTKRERGGWRMQTDKASRRAWRGLGIKDFESLADVEAHYKSWRGIGKLIEESSN